MKQKVFLTLVLGSTLIFGGCANTQEESPEPQPQPKRTTVRVDRRGGFFLEPVGNGFVFRRTPGARVVVQVRINDGPPAPFIVDTGSPTTYIVRSYTSGVWHGTPTLAAFPLAGGMVQSLRTQVHSLQIGSFRFENWPVEIVDLPALAQEGVAGLIGDDILSTSKMTIDYRASWLTLEE